MDWGEFVRLMIVGTIQFMLGSWWGVRKYKQTSSNPYKFHCYSCDDQGKFFEFSSKDPEITKRIAQGHVLEFHPLIT